MPFMSKVCVIYSQTTGERLALVVPSWGFEMLALSEGESGSVVGKGVQAMGEVLVVLTGWTRVDPNGQLEEGGLRVCWCEG